MSIEGQLVARETDGSIYAFKPPKGFKAKRALYLSIPVLREITGTNTNVAFHKCKMDIERVFDSWVKGDEIRVSTKGSGKGATLAKLDPPPDGVWELRITEPRVQFRVFCQFAKKDFLVATAIENRGVLGNKYTANGKFAREWQRVLQHSNKEWGRLFPTFDPLSTPDLNLLLSGWTNAVRD
jgi:hypothetical protein